MYWIAHERIYVQLIFVCNLNALEIGGGDGISLLGEIPRRKP